jgi:hypothetical protein
MDLPQAELYPDTYTRFRGLTIGCNQKWIAEQTRTSVQMIQENYGKYIRDDGLCRNL